MAKLKHGLLDISSALQMAHKIEDPATRECMTTMAKALDVIIRNQQAMVGLSENKAKGVTFEENEMVSIQDLLDMKVIREYNTNKITKLLSRGREEKRYIARGYKGD